MKQIKQFSALLVGLMTSSYVFAASLLPTGVFTGVATDATDTITDVMLYVVPIAVGVAVGKAVLGWAKGGTSKALR
jgi:hypothetical protein